MKSINLFLEQKQTTVHEMFKEIISIYSRKFQWNLKHMKLKVTNQGRYSDGKIADHLSEGEFGGSWTNKGIIYINQDMDSVKKFYKVTLSTHDLTVILISHELAHEVYKNILEEKEKSKWNDMIKKQNFTSPYLKHVSKEQFTEELFCEYIAYQILNEFKK